MIRAALIATAALVLGAAIGWKGKAIVSDAASGIQWRFNNAARWGDVAQMKRLLSDGADPLAQPFDSARGVGGFTPLLEAAEAGKPDSVEFLISVGGDVNSVESDTCPLDAAMHRRAEAEKTIEILRGAGARPLAEALQLRAGNAEQGVAPQSATRSESDSEGGDKPQPEPEARSR